MNICIFEDSFTSNLSPVNDLRHTTELICGALTLREKLENIFPMAKHRFCMHTRKYLESYCKERFAGIPINLLTKENTLFLNSRVIFTRSFIEGLLLTLDEFENTALLSGKTVAAAYVTASKLNQLKTKAESRTERNLLDFNDFHSMKLKEVQIDELNNEDEPVLINYPSDLILNHEKEINCDLKKILASSKNAKTSRTHAEIINRQKVFISQNCIINSHVVLDASHGAIYISPEVTIEPFTYIQGPVYIGKNTTVKAGSKLYGPVRIGKHCKVSGEIASSVIHSYFNKQHLGFLGHSYMCEWVNLGAGTTTSNLKNNYSPITVNYGGRTTDTGSIFLGSIIGDHTKTGINSMLNSGTMVGISSNLFGGGYQQKTLKPFSWADADSGKITKYDIEKAVQTAKISMKRRNVAMTRTYENLLRYHFKKEK